MKTYKYKIGDKIKLKDYYGKGEQPGFNEYIGWSDWRLHIGQIAEIIDIISYSGMNYRIRWNDGSISGIPEHNVEMVYKALLSIQEHLNKYKR